MRNLQQFIRLVKNAILVDSTLSVPPKNQMLKFSFPSKNLK